MYAYSIYSVYHTKFAPHHKCSLTGKKKFMYLKKITEFFTISKLQTFCTDASLKIKLE